MGCCQECTPGTYLPPSPSPACPLFKCVVSPAWNAGSGPASGEKGGGGWVEPPWGSGRGKGGARLHAEPWGGLWLLAVDRRLKPSGRSGETRPLLPSLSGQLFPWTPSDSPTPLSSFQEPAGPWPWREGVAGSGVSMVGGPRSRATALLWSPPPPPGIRLPEVNGRKEGRRNRSDDDSDFFFSSAGAWGGRLFGFLDLSGEFSARQSSRRFPCFPMLL